MEEETSIYATIKTEMIFQKERVYNQMTKYNNVHDFCLPLCSHLFGDSNGKNINELYFLVHIYLEKAMTRNLSINA